MMRRTLAAILIVLVALVAGARAQSSSDAAAAKAEVEAGGRAYRQGNYAAAEQHFRRAVELDPAVKNGRLFIARAVQQQYKPGIGTPENVATGERAVAAYEDLLREDPSNEDGYKAVVFLYSQMKNEEKVNELLTRRAETDSLAPERRAEAYTILASRQWQCAYDITERKENKETVQAPDRVLIKYKMPSDSAEFYKAQQCAAEGMRLADLALALDANGSNALSYKTNLLRESAKLAEMEGNEAQAADYRKQADESLAKYERQRDEPGGKAEPDKVQLVGESSTAQAEPGKKGIVSGGVLNGKAVSKPAPAYPDEAKAAGVAGTVTVRVLVDEEGNVVEAEAISGPEPLRAAAVEAARQARLSPTRLSGEPVRVTGVLTYTFALQ